MNARATVMSLCLLGSALTPLVSSAQIGVDITVAPPAPQVEVVPAPRAGYVWAPGYWNWVGGRHVWVGGHWIGARPGYRWVPDAWVRHGDRWHYARGHWAR